VQRRLNSVVYDIEYRVEVEGTDTSAVSAALDSLTNDTSPLAAVVQQTMNDQSVSGAFLVEYVGEPVEELWMYTTATMTSTISVTSTSGTMSESSSTSSSTTTRKICYADSIPYMPNVADSSSCVGIFSGTSCSPVCISGYELVAPITCTDTSNSSDTFGEFEFNPVVCVPEAHVEALDSADVLLVEAALIESEANSNLSADWAAGAEVQAAIISAFSTALELYEGQVYIASIADLNSDSESGIPASRRMTTAQGLWMRVLIQLYPTNSETDLRASLANLDTISEELTAALQNFGIGVPPGLATASLVVGVPASSTAIAPVARWVARTQWSLCSNVCGEGQRIRTVECLTNSTGLCNSNAPPDYTMESFMPETIVCQQYTECPYDWTCPSGKEPVTGGGCEVQASLVICAMVVSFFIVSCCLIRYVRRLNASKAPTKEQSTTRLDPMSDKGADIEWTREEGIVDKKGKHKATGCATLTLQDGSGDSDAAGRLGPVDLDLSGAVDFELGMKVRTTSRDALLVGKVHRRWEMAANTGKAKALVIKSGVLAWQVGDDCIVGKTNIADGMQHEVSVLYKADQGMYILRVDGKVEARGLSSVPDNPDTNLVLGTASAPRDDTFNELYAVFEDLRSLGVGVLQLEERREEPLFEGDIDQLTWKELQWNKSRRKKAWVAYDLHIGTMESTRQRTSNPTASTKSQSGSEARSALSTSSQAFHKGQDVEYWSKTMQAWLPAKIVDSREKYFDNNLRFDVFDYDVYVGTAEQTVPGVEIKDLRIPFVEGDAVSVYSHRHGRWFPARIHRSRDGDPKQGYDVTLEDELADDQETYVKSALQRDLEKHRRERGSGSWAGSGSGDAPAPILKNLPAKRLRRRYNGGDRVRLYKGADAGFVPAEVVREEAEDEPRPGRGSPSPSRAARGGSPSPAGGRGRSPGAEPPARGRSLSSGSGGGGARRDAGDRRFAMVLVRVTDSERDTMATVSECLLRPGPASTTPSVGRDADSRGSPVRPGLGGGRAGRGTFAV